MRHQTVAFSFAFFGCCSVRGFALRLSFHFWWIRELLFPSPIPTSDLLSDLCYLIQIWEITYDSSDLRGRPFERIEILCVFRCHAWVKSRADIPPIDGQAMARGTLHFWHAK